MSYRIATLLIPMVTAGALAGHNLEEVATFEHQVTGVTVTEDNRIFVNFPRWSEDAPISVAELKDGKVIAYPDEAWNAWRNAGHDNLNPAEHWVCVQSVVADRHGSVWVIDPGAPSNGPVVKGAPKLVQIDLKTNHVAKTVPFGPDVAKQASYLNDIRFSPDAKWAYITDSGAEGAIVVVNLESGKARRLLDTNPATQFEPGVVVHADGKPLRRPDGRGPIFSADGIAIAPDGSNLYWQALTGKTLYRISTTALQDESLDEKMLAGKIEKVGENGVADGLIIDRDDRMFVSSPEDNSIKIRPKAEGDRLESFLRDDRLRWPDTFSIGGGYLYVTSSHIQDSAWFKPQQGPQLKTELWKVKLH